jgi:hypothetical protein
MRAARDFIHSEILALVSGTSRMPLPPGTISVSTSGADLIEQFGLKTIPDSEVQGLSLSPMTSVS